MADKNNFTEYDSLYGTITLPSILLKIINTKEFQRLRRIKQLGGAEYVFKDATHTRYQHSIGTAYLAGQLVRDLQRHSYERGKLNIDERHIECVYIAALCHDLGHGPFSYLFQDKVLPRLGIEPYKHRELACEMFEKIWKNIIKYEPGMKDYLRPEHMIFIKEMIQGNPENQGQDDLRMLLCQLFSHSHIGHNLCKLDYMARDCWNCGYRQFSPVDLFQTLIKNQGFIQLTDSQHSFKWNDEFQNTCDKLNVLHDDIYQHPKVNAVEHMIADTIVLADEYLKISNRFHDLNFFNLLDDHILSAIRNEEGYWGFEMKEAKRTLERLENGKHYKLVLVQPVRHNVSSDAIMQQLHQSINVVSIRLSVLKNRATQSVAVVKDQNIIQVFWADPVWEQVTVHKIVEVCNGLVA